MTITVIGAKNSFVDKKMTSEVEGKQNSIPEKLMDCLCKYGHDMLVEELGLDIETLELITNALVYISRTRYKYPFMNTKESLSMRMALYLISHNNKYSQEWRQKCIECLTDFEKECHIIPFFAEYGYKSKKLTEEIEDENERREYSMNAQIFDQVKSGEHKVPGSSLFKLQ